jgi:hypothetical protein
MKPCAAAAHGANYFVDINRLQISIAFAHAHGRRRVFGGGRRSGIIDNIYGHDFFTRMKTNDGSIGGREIDEQTG